MRNEGLIRSLGERLSRLSGGRSAILTHYGGDPDSIAAAYVLSKILKSSLNISTSFKIPAEVSAQGKALMEMLGMKEAGDINSAEAFIVLDCGSPEQLDDYVWILESGRDVLVIDHHSTSVEGFRGRAEVFCSEDYQSVSEIILDLAEHLGYRVDVKDAEALFAGIYYDTARLSIADEETMMKICRLASLGVNPGKLLATLEAGMDFSERVARLKSALRMRVYRIGEWLIAASRLGSFQSSSARSLVNLGAHVAIVAGESDGGVAVSFRAVKDFIEATGLNLARDLAAIIASETGGHGGGHASAARAYCARGGVEEILERCIRILSEKLGKPAEMMAP